MNNAWGSLPAMLCNQEVCVVFLFFQGCLYADIKGVTWNAGPHVTYQEHYETVTSVVFPISRDISQHTQQSSGLLSCETTDFSSLKLKTCS